VAICSTRNSHGPWSTPWAQRWQSTVYAVIFGRGQYKMWTKQQQKLQCLKAAVHICLLHHHHHHQKCTLCPQAPFYYVSSWQLGTYKEQLLVCIFRPFQDKERSSDIRVVMRIQNQKVKNDWESSVTTDLLSDLLTSLSCRRHVWVGRCRAVARKCRSIWSKETTTYSHAVNNHSSISG